MALPEHANTGCLCTCTRSCGPSSTSSRRMAATCASSTRKPRRSTSHEARPCCLRVASADINILVCGKVGVGKPPSREPPPERLPVPGIASSRWTPTPTRCSARRSESARADRPARRGAPGPGDWPDRARALDRTLHRALRQGRTRRRPAWSLIESARQSTCGGATRLPVRFRLGASSERLSPLRGRRATPEEAPPSNRGADPGQPVGQGHDRAHARRIGVYVDRRVAVAVGVGDGLLVRHNHVLELIAERRSDDV